MGVSAQLELTKLSTTKEQKKERRRERAEGRREGGKQREGGGGGGGGVQTSPVLSILAAMLTVSPKTSYL